MTAVAMRKEMVDELRRRGEVEAKRRRSVTVLEASAAVEASSALSSGVRGEGGAGRVEGINQVQGQRGDGGERKQLLARLRELSVEQGKKRRRCFYHPLGGLPAAAARNLFSRFMVGRFFAELC